MAEPQAPRIGQALTIGERKSSELGEPPKSGIALFRRLRAERWWRCPNNLYLCSRLDRLIQWRV